MTFLSEIARPDRVQLLDEPYADDSPAQVLDVYMVRPPETKRAIVTIFGGGWAGGDKRSNGPYHLTYIKAFLDAGFTVININYRLSGEAPWPACLHDVLAAVRWAKANYSKLCIDPNRIGLWGGSAGGHLALMAGVCRAFDPPPPAPPAMPPRLRERRRLRELERPPMMVPPPAPFVRAVSAGSAPTDFKTWDADTLAKGFPLFNGVGWRAPGTALSNLMGFDTAPSSADAYLDAASPLTYVNGAPLPRVQLLAGTQDATVPDLQSRRLATAMSRCVGATCNSLSLAAGHSDGPFLDPATVGLVTRFFEEAL